MTITKEILEEIIPGGTKITLKNLQDKFEPSTTPLREAMRMSYPNILIAFNILSHKQAINLFVVVTGSKIRMIEDHISWFKLNTLLHNLKSFSKPHIIIITCIFTIRCP